MLPAQAKNQSGQILVIFLLVLVVGLAITLSIASRTVTDIRQTTTSDESNRSYFAAESGVEKALRLIEDSTGTPIPPGTVDLNGVNRSTANYTVVDSGATSGQVFEFPNPFGKDEVAQVSLMSDFNDLTSVLSGTSYRNNSTLTIYWDEGSGIPDPNQPAIEVSIVTCTSNCSSGTPTFDIKKMLFDPKSGRTTNACLAPTSSDGNITTNQGNVINYKYKVALALNSSCGNNDVISSATEYPIMARIRFLYNPTSVKLGVMNPGGVLPTQGQTITSTGSTPSGVTRKLVVTRLYPSLPAIFDYVLFNGSANPLTK